MLLRSVFHPALFCSLMGQFIAHVSCMMYAVSCAKEHLPEDWKPAMRGEFSPNLINTVVFLVETVQQVSVLLVNYKGRPFMLGLSENGILLQSLASAMAGAVVCAYELIPTLNEWLQLVTFPTDQLRITILTILVINISFTLAWDRLCLWIFAPHILRASAAEYSWEGVFAGLKKIVMFSTILGLLFVEGGIWVLLPGWWMYSKYKRGRDEAAKAKAEAES
eukprot:NODE_3029_length_1291_cov_130.647260_g27_i1.p1 GENE.NODE_3029_length_1291_cov_130.647260_g27_i1~~NODE_3029_length_1291_cov_130.647260_g27_i1.p1  ORF type:complete len:221 (-),score=40.23 NODE_3029_length_1291_cov_130.647260_g27_i1:180-842(-)